MGPKSESSPPQASNLALKHPLLVRKLESGSPPLSAQHSESNARQAAVAHPLAHCLAHPLYPK